MERSLWERCGEYQWRRPPVGAMRVPVMFHGDEALLVDLDDTVMAQAMNVASLPGIIDAAHVLPDGHQGYGFPIGAVAAFDPEESGVVSAGGVGFDIACGVRCLITGLRVADVVARQSSLADTLWSRVPAGVGSTGLLRLSDADMDAMLRGGARWAVERGFGDVTDLQRLEHGGVEPGADPSAVSARARARQRDELGTLGSGNHYLEVQRVQRVVNADVAAAFGIAVDDVVVSIHCGSRGLGHQVGTDALRTMVQEAPTHGFVLPDRELACAPITSTSGQRYLGAMRAAIDCAHANRQVLTHLCRQVFADVFGDTACVRVLYDVAHNTCRVEDHVVDGRRRRLFVHRKGATRALGPGHAALPADLRAVGQPVFVGGTMGTASWILVGAAAPAETAGRPFSSASHGAGRRMSRHAAARAWHGRAVVDELARAGVLVRATSLRGIAEEAPGAYKDIDAVVDATEGAGLATKVARLVPLVCIKG
jgi:tRNA-splicing ligase RtcB